MTTSASAPPSAGRATATSRPSPALLATAAGGVAGAGIVHLAVVPDHLAEYALFGVFFAVVGVAQLAVAVLIVLRPNRRLAGVVAAATLGLLGLWLVSRTVGLPVGPAPGRPEDVGVPDVACVALEVLAVFALAVLALRPPHPRRRRAWRTVLTVTPVALLALILTALGAGTGLAGMPVGVNVAPADPGHPSTPITDLVAGPGPQPVRAFTLTAQPGVVDGKPAETFNGTVPGPELRVTQGDRVGVTLVNHLPVPTTLHWHGVRVPGAEDGVAGITQDAVPPGGRFTYEFVASDAGTYWYHSHQDTGNQIPEGLLGALVVEPRPTAPSRGAADRDYPIVLHNAPGVPATAINGQTGALRLPAEPGQTVRLRVIDAVTPGMNGGPETPVLLGAPYRIVALDGHDLTGPETVGPQRIPLGMGQRADLVFTMPPQGSVRLMDDAASGAPSLLEPFFPQQRHTASAVIGGDSAPGSASDSAQPSPAQLAALPVFDATHYGVPAADPVAAAVRTAGATSHDVVLAETPGFHDGAVQLMHTMNGATSPGVPPITVHTGQTVRLHLVNDTGEYHPMHPHGHVLSVLDVDGRPPSGSPLRQDTVLLSPHQTMDVAFLADNPGIWMFHCHVLLHASMGMSMTIDYAGVSTPFEMGSRSGNTPE